MLYAIMTIDYFINHFVAYKKYMYNTSSPRICIRYIYRLWFGRNVRDKHRPM